MTDLATYECRQCRRFSAVAEGHDPGICPDCGCDALDMRAVASPRIVFDLLTNGGPTDWAEVASNLKGATDGRCDK